MEINTEELKLKAQLAARKNAVRLALAKRGVLQKGGTNNFDHYKYFSEAQYKELFTDLFSACGLEMTVSVAGYAESSGTEKQQFGRTVTLEITLTDCSTGYSETVTVYGEGMDKGDKGGYKAYTGALKYYLANTFMVATGDDPETESQEGKKTAPVGSTKKASEGQIAVLRQIYTGANLAKLLQLNGIERIEDLSMAKASELIEKNKQRKATKKESTPPPAPPAPDLDDVPPPFGYEEG